jgi:carboxypeptidase PM20D1
MLSEVIVAQAPGSVVAPALVVGGTDTRHYATVTPNGFRFLPIRFALEDFERVHGRDERLSIENFHFAIEFYERLIRRAAGGGA